MKVQPIQKIVKAFNRDKKRNQKYYWTGKKKPEPEEKFEDFMNVEDIVDVKYKH
jgi:hypothetical protein|nr:MAG TPA: hypothetical protein [Caudoviricetes sp.]